MPKLIPSLLLFLLSTASLSYAQDQAKSIVAEIRAVPIFENGDPLIDLRNQTIIAYNSELILKNPSCTYVRKAVYEKLCPAQTLLPQDLRFQLQVGLRSLNIQALLFDKQYAVLKQQFPFMNEKELFFETSKFAAPVKTWEGAINVTPHSTGGAIDIILLDLQGGPVDMGVDLDNPFQDEEAIRIDATSISTKARKNRNIMASVLSKVGFVNYPGEFWHWSYGDRRWAFINHLDHAIYGPIEFLPESD